MYPHVYAVLQVSETQVLPRSRPDFDSGLTIRWPPVRHCGIGNPATRSYGRLAMILRLERRRSSQLWAILGIGSCKGRGQETQSPFTQHSGTRGSNIHVTMA